MFPFTLRKNKGSPLTHQEMDSNFENSLFPPFLHIQDQKTQGTNGGTFTSGAWQTRDLNTVLTNTISGASLASNQITLPAGKYYVEASAPAYYVGDLYTRHQAKIIKTNPESDLIIGTSEITRPRGPSELIVTCSKMFGLIDLGSNATICIVHRITNGGVFGAGANFTTEVYSDIRIWRIGEYVAP